MNWTKNLPTESGFYWYRWGGSKNTEIVRMEFLETAFPDGVRSARYFYVTGTDVFYDDTEIDGEFWPEKLVEPKGS